MRGGRIGDRGDGTRRALLPYRIKGKTVASEKSGFRKYRILQNGTERSEKAFLSTRDACGFNVRDVYVTELYYLYNKI